VGLVLLALRLVRRSYSEDGSFCEVGSLVEGVMTGLVHRRRDFIHRLVRRSVSEVGSFSEV